MKFSIQLPTDRVGEGAEFVSAEAIADVAQAAERAGFHAAYVTEHPFPDDRWMRAGGHHALDPFVALSFAASATTSLRVMTNILVLPYRNPFLTAKAAASLDVLSGGRVILGVAAGYLKGEFAALGVDFSERNDLSDEAIVAITRAWSEEGIEMSGQHFSVRGNTMLPRPLQQPRPPIWVGGNARRAIRRAVELGDGWIPFPSSAGPLDGEAGDARRSRGRHRLRARTCGEGRSSGAPRDLLRTLRIQRVHGTTPRSRRFRGHRGDPRCSRGDCYAGDAASPVFAFGTLRRDCILRRARHRPSRLRPGGLSHGGLVGCFHAMEDRNWSLDQRG